MYFFTGGCFIIQRVSVGMTSKRSFSWVKSFRHVESFQKVLQSLICYLGLFPLTFPHYLHMQLVRLPKNGKFLLKLSVKDTKCNVIYRIFMSGAVAFWTSVPETTCKLTCGACISCSPKNHQHKLDQTVSLYDLKRDMLLFFFLNDSNSSHCIEALEKVLC